MNYGDGAVPQEPVEARPSEDVFLNIAEDEAIGDRHTNTRGSREQLADTDAMSPSPQPQPHPDNTQMHWRSAESSATLSARHRLTAEYVSPSRAINNESANSSSGIQRRISQRARADGKIANSASRRRDHPSPRPSLRLQAAREDTTKGDRGQPGTPQDDRHSPSYSSGQGLTKARLDRIGRVDTALEDGGSVNGTFTRDTTDKQQADFSPAASDSVDSQTAASTVWDELDDLKSRINKLELTGKLPASSNAAASRKAADRPRTATTAPTTISSSPRQLRKASAAPSEICAGDQGRAGAHPLLQSALAKSKSLLSIPVYRALETSAADALALTALTGGTGPQGTAFSAASIINGVTVSDRQIKRKADSMCRNLTDLCIALCDAKTEASEPSSSPISVFRQQRETPPSTRRSYGAGDRGPHIAEGSEYSPGRSYTRLEERRISLGLTTSRRQSQEASQRSGEADRSPSTTPKDYTAQYSSPAIHHVRTRSRFDDRREAEQLTRAPSRALTEAGQSRQLPAHRREFVDASHQRSPSLRETLAARRGNVGITEMDGRSEMHASPYTAQSLSSRRLAEASRSAMSEVGDTTLGRRRRLTSLDHEPLPTRLGSPLMRAGSLKKRRIDAE